MNAIFQKYRHFFATLISVLCLLVLFYLVSIGDVRNIQIAKQEIIGVHEILTLLKAGVQTSKVEEPALLKADELEKQITTLGDISGLILDPDLDSYYLMSILVQNVPAMYRQILINQLLLPTQSTPPRQQLHSLAVSIRESLDKVIANDKDFHGKIYGLETNLNGAFARLKQTCLDSDSSGDSQIEALLKFSDVVSENLVLALEHRISDLNLRLLSSLVLTTIVGIVLLLLLRTANNLTVANSTLSEEVSDRTEKLEDSDRLVVLGEMAGGIAHEINNLLTVIVARLPAIRKQLLLPEPRINEALQSIDKVEKSAKLIQNIVKGIKTISRKSDDDPFEVFNLSLVINDSLSFCLDRFKHSGIDLKTNVSVDVMAEGRPAQISQIVLNFLNNAFDAIHFLDTKKLRSHFKLWAQ